MLERSNSIWFKSFPYCSFKHRSHWTIVLARSGSYPRETTLAQETMAFGISGWPWNGSRTTLSSSAVTSRTLPCLGNRPEALAYRIRWLHLTPQNFSKSALVFCLWEWERVSECVCFCSFCSYNCIVPIGFLPWEIRVAFPGESQLRQSRATKPTVHAGCFSVSIIHRILTWTTGSLTCTQMLMQAMARGVYGHT